VYDLFGKRNQRASEGPWQAILNGLKQWVAGRRGTAVFDLFGHGSTPDRKPGWGGTVASLLLHVLLLLLVLGVFRRAEKQAEQRRPQEVAGPIFFPVPPPPPPPRQRQNEMEFQKPPGAVQGDVARAGEASEPSAQNTPAPEPTGSPATAPSQSPAPPKPPEQLAEAPKPAEPETPGAKTPAQPAPPGLTKPSTEDQMVVDARRLFGPKPAPGEGEEGHGPKLGEQFQSSVGDRSQCLKESEVRDSTGQLGRVAGRVFNENHRPLAGAFLMILGTQYSTFSDANGAFVLQFDPTLVANCRTQAVRVTAPGYLGRDLILYAGRSPSNDVVLPRR
jgi:hypothetical protein